MGRQRLDQLPPCLQYNTGRARFHGPRVANPLILSLISGSGGVTQSCAPRERLPFVCGSDSNPGCGGLFFVNIHPVQIQHFLGAVIGGGLGDLA